MKSPVTPACPHQVFDHKVNIGGGDQQQEQTDTNPRAVGNTHRDIAQNPCPDTGDRDQGKQHPHQEDRAQYDQDRDILTKYHAECGKGGQGNRTADSHRQICP